jgi:hypothetical protein
MENSMALAKAAAAEFVERMAPEDQASVIEIDSRVQVLQPNPGRGPRTARDEPRARYRLTPVRGPPAHG